MKQRLTLKWLCIITAFILFSMGLAKYANADSLPKPQEQNGIPFVTGGIGLDESQAMRREASHWPLAMRFTDISGSYLANAQVKIIDSKNSEIFKAESDGPYMFVRLRPGHYTIYAHYQGNEMKRSIDVPSRKLLQFYWK